MRSPKDFFRPLAVGAPEPLHEIPFRPSRMLHFFPPNNDKMRAKVPGMVGTVDVLVANLEDGVPMADKEAARAGLIEVATTIDVIIFPKVEGPEDIHYADRLIAQLEARAGISRPILIHAILETARGVANVEEICLASPRMQGLSLGPADLAANRRMKTTRVGGGHPDYLVRDDPNPDHPEAERATHQQDLWHYTLARMVDACVTAGILPYYGPFGDIRDLTACGDQFRNAYLLGCVGAWTLHPDQIAVAREVFSPSAAEVAHARRVIDAMGDGTGAIMLDGKMEDDASVKQCRVVVALAEQLAASDPGLAELYAAP